MRCKIMYMNTNGARLRELIEGAGLTQESALEIFNKARPKLFQPYSISAWKAFLVSPTSTRWRPFSDQLLERAENIFVKLQHKA
jgi:hypothetical protein